MNTGASVSRDNPSQLSSTKLPQGRVSVRSGFYDSSNRPRGFDFPTFRVAGLPALVTRRLRRAPVEVMLRAGVSMRRATALRSCLELAPENFLFTTNFRSRSSAAQKIEVDLKFEDGKEAFKSKTTSELVRAYLVLKLSSIDYIVSHNHQVSLTTSTSRTRNMSSRRIRIRLETCFENRRHFRIFRSNA